MFEGGGRCYLYIPGVAQFPERECCGRRDQLQAGVASGWCPAPRILTSHLHLHHLHLLAAAAAVAGTVAGNLTMSGC